MAKKVNKCPCCGSHELKITFKGMYDKSYLKSGKFDLTHCLKCGLDFVNPIMNEEELGKYYPAEEYYSFYDYNKMALVYHKLSALVHSGRSMVLSVLFSPFKSLLYTYHLDKGKSILEIGCGNGMMLDIYRKYGMKTAGLEPYGPALSEREKNLGIDRNNVKNAKYESESFDYIVLKEVLEHVPDQKLVLDKCNKWLKKGGKIIITVPNTDGIWKRVYGKNWFGYDVPRHVYNYNPKNIGILLRKHGFKSIKVREYDTPYMLDGSMKFSLVEKTGKKEHPIVFSNFSKVLFAPISLMVNYFGTGSLMEVEASK